MNKLEIKNTIKNFLNKNQIDNDALDFCIASVEQDIDANVRLMEMVLFSFATTKKDFFTTKDTKIRELGMLN